MTVIRSHDFSNGVAGAAIAVGDGSGFDVVGGTVNYIAGGYSGQGAEMATGTNYVQDNIAPGFYGAWWKAPTLPSGGAALDRIVNSTGGTVAACTLGPDGTLRLWESLSTQDTVSTVAVTAGQWFRTERQLGATSHTLRIFLDPTSNTPDEEITGTSTGTPAKYMFGLAWAANSTGPLDVDGITLTDAWPNLGTPAPVTHQLLINGVWTPVTEKALIGGVWTPVTETIVTGAAAQASTFPMTFPATLA